MTNTTFTIGQTVEIIDGANTGEVGTIIDMPRGWVAVQLDDGMVKVRASQLDEHPTVDEDFDELRS